MSLHGGIQARLSAQVTTVSSRVWRDHLPQNPTLPACSFYVVSMPQLVEVGTGTNELIHPRIEVWSWADTHSGAQTTADEVKAALHKWSGTSDSTVFDHAIYDTARDHYDPDLGLWAVVQEYMVMYHE